MAFVDEITIEAKAGRGGDGVVRWLHIKGKEKGGPAGGDGGRGGDVILEGVRDLAALASYRYTKSFRAENGENGESNNKHGADGAPIIIRIPVGTTATIPSSRETFDILTEGEEIVAFKGGGGGYGNAHYKSSVNQNPKEVTQGKQGEGGEIRFELKLIADAGLIGFPNAGKSSLLNALTRARSKVGAYPFTTLDPHLGDFYGFLLADIPGLIEGSSAGRGLGSKFLRHIERTRMLVHLISAEQEDPRASYLAIRKELEAFGHELARKPELVVLSKTDVVSEEEKAQKLADLTEAAEGRAVATLSILDETELKKFNDTLANLLREHDSR